MPPKVDNNKEALELAKSLNRVVKMAEKPSGSPKKGKNKKKKARKSGTAQIRFARTELVASVTLDASKRASGSIPINPLKCKAPILVKLAACFERSRWEKVHFYWKPAVSAMFSGTICMGADWDNKSPASEKAKIMAYAPSALFPIREDTQTKPLRLDPGRLRSRLWFDHSDSADNISTAATLAWVADGQDAVAVGDLFMDYVVVLDGPHS